jgi:two-component system response regulator YesN
VDAYRKRLGIYGNELQSMQEHFEEQLQSKETVQDLVVVFQETLKHLLALTLKPVQVSQSIRMEEAKRFIDENFNQNLKLEGVARENGFSISAFGRAFKKEFGVGFSAYLRKVRLEHAKKLLVSTRLPISQVIQESGFNNPQYFFDLFKRSIGFTPQKFRDSFDR